MIVSLGVSLTLLAGFGVFLELKIARIGVVIFALNYFENLHIHRCFTNSLEQILTVIAFHFYLKQGNRFTISTVLLTALITIAFIGRNTSIVGWIPLLVIKVLYEGSLQPFIVSAITVAVPLMAGMVYIDTMYYGGDVWVLTSINFLKVNVL